MEPESILAGNSVPPHDSGLSVCVLATTVDGTGHALSSAKRLVRGLAGARILLLVPKSRAQMSHAEWRERMDRSYDLACRLGVEVTVLTCVCQRPDEVALQMIGPSSLLVIGGRRQIWWPSREARLVDRLAKRGDLIVFADMRAGGAAERVQQSGA